MTNRQIKDLENSIGSLDCDDEYQEFLAFSGPISIRAESLENSLKNIMQFYDQHIAQQTSLPPSTESSES